MIRHHKLFSRNNPKGSVPCAPKVSSAFSVVKPSLALPSRPTSAGRPTTTLHFNYGERRPCDAVTHYSAMAG